MTFKVPVRFKIARRYLVNIWKSTKFFSWKLTKQKWRVLPRAQFRYDLVEMRLGLRKLRIKRNALLHGNNFIKVFRYSLGNWSLKVFKFLYLKKVKTITATPLLFLQYVYTRFDYFLVHVGITSSLYESCFWVKRGMFLINQRLAVKLKGCLGTYDVVSFNLQQPGASRLLRKWQGARSRARVYQKFGIHSSSYVGFLLRHLLPNFKESFIIYTANEYYSKLSEVTDYGYFFNYPLSARLVLQRVSSGLR